MRALFHEVKIEQPQIQIDETIIERHLPNGFGIDSEWNVYKNRDKKIYVCSNTFCIRDNQGGQWRWVNFEARINILRPEHFTIFFPEIDEDKFEVKEMRIEILQELGHINCATNFAGLYIDEDGNPIYANIAFERGKAEIEKLRESLFERIGYAIKRMNKRIRHYNQ